MFHAAVFARSVGITLKIKTVAEADSPQSLVFTVAAADTQLLFTSH